MLADLGANWYAHDTVSTRIAVDAGYRSEAPPDGLSFDGSIDYTRVGAALTARWLPPLAANRWVLLEGRLAYARLGVKLSADRFDGSNMYEVGAVLRIVLPGVPSLKVLAREY